MMKKISPRELRRLQSRMMESLGLNIKEQGVADEVIIRFQDKEVLIRNPSVMVMQFGDETIYHLVGGSIEIRTKMHEEVTQAYEPSPEDVSLVALQAGVSEEEARKALIEAGGDLAKAILLLKSK